MTILKTARFALLFLPFAVSSCSFHDINLSPEPAAQAHGFFGDLEGNQAAASQSGPWYSDFNDPALQELIATALENNFDLKAALARLDAARAVSAQSGAALLPALDGQAQSGKSIEDGDPEPGVSSFGAALSWEADIFGRLRAQSTRDDFEARAAAEDVEFVKLSLSADLALAYYGAVAQQRQLALLGTQEELDSRYLDLVDLRFREGLGTRVDILQQQSQLAATRTLIPLAQRDLRIFENRLDVLSGQAPDAQNRLSEDQDFAVLGTLPPLGVPADLLLSRPDLRALRERLISQDAEIAAAIADRLPRITLTGSYIYADGPLTAAPVGTLLAGLAQPLLDWGRRRAVVEENKALYEEQLAQFTQAYLTAIEQVENALYTESRQREFIGKLRERQAILQENVTQAEALYKEGLTDYLPVISALQELRVTERSLISEQYNLIRARIDLYRALGGRSPQRAPEGAQGISQQSDDPQEATP